MSFGLGITAALAAPLTMTLGFIVWDNHWTGSAFALNMFKCNLASIGFVVLSAVTRDQPFSPDVFTGESVGFLMLSSAIGILVGDYAWLEGLRLLGARKVIVMDSLKPFLAAVFGWALLGEQLQWAALGGIACTVVGILLVSLEDSGPSPSNGDEEPDEDGAQEGGIQPSVVENSESQKKDADISTRTDITVPVDRSSHSLATGSLPTELVSEAMNQDEAEVRMDPLAAATGVANNNGGTGEEEEQAVVTDETTRRRSSTNATKRAQSRYDFYYGYGMAIINVLLDTYGSVLTKEHGSKFTSWEINLVRFGFAGLVMLACSLLLQARDWVRGDPDASDASGDDNNDGTDDEERQQQHETATTAALEDTHTAWYKLPLDTMSLTAWIHVVGGVLFVTFFTPALSNYALFQIALALALTLGSIGPLYALPLTYLLQKDQAMPTLQACLGAVLAVAGIVILSFWGTLE